MQIEMRMTSKFNGIFLVQRYISCNIFMKIRLVVFMRIC